ncbi:protein phosphatase [Methylosinus sp. sav-2]|uniref:PP2C family protein-serine/threonine phosphatase n=1 Tax=unclassified Methylosinus TaxID=2624500 RepID=UPI0004640C44|nr:MULTISPECIES: protein phosphatase 2C domain-containing protein [unclassified Methylosinus]TDX67024.1 protein phosphatase [Methylosinus sp. sav-2]
MSGMADLRPMRAFALSDKGRVRAENEDNFLSKPHMGLFAVADGMGGHAAGATASAVVVDSLSRVAPQGAAAELRRQCEAALQGAHRDIQRQAALRGVGTMGSTVVMLLTFDRYYACLWAGDSRAYLLRGGDIVQITIDHTEAEQLLADGVLTPEEARNWPRRNVITRAVGAGETLALDFVNGELFEGDMFVLCSDGLTGHVTAAEIAGLASGRAPEEACRALIDLALARGGTDNVTVLVAAYRQQEEEPTRLRPGREESRETTRPR